MGFLGCNILQIGGSKIYQPFIGGGSNCNYSVYTDGVETIKVPFVNCSVVTPLRLLKSRINEGVDLWVDRSLNVNIGSAVVSNIGGSTTNNTSDFYNGIFTGGTSGDYSGVNYPRVGTVQLLTDDTDGIKIDGAESLLSHDSDWSVVCVDYVSAVNRGWPWSVGGSDLNSMLGIENDPTLVKIKMHWYGNEELTGWSLLSSRTQCVVSVNDSVAKEFRLYIDGVLAHTMDTSLLTPTTNSLKFVRGSRHSTMSDDNNFTECGNIQHIHTRIANYAFDADDAYAEYRNPNKTATIQFMGDSVLENGISYNYYTQVTNQWYNEGKEINFLRDAVGGTTFYQSMVSSYLYKQQDGGYVPNEQTRPINVAPSRNLDTRFSKYKFDAVFFGYTGNYTSSGKLYIYGENGFNNQGYGEYLRGFELGLKSYCDINNIIMFLNSPQPKGDDELASGTSSRRTDIHYNTTQELVYLFGEDCLNTFDTLATIDNKMPAEYTTDGTHLTELGYNQLVNPIINRFDKYYKTAHPIVTVTNYLDGAVPSDTTQPITLNYDLDFGVIESRSQQFTLIAGENTVTITGTTPDGISYSKDYNLYYGDLLSNPTSYWGFDTITTSKVLDEVGTNDISIFGTETISGGYWTLDAVNNDYGRILNSNALFPVSGSPFSFAMWVYPTFVGDVCHFAGRVGSTASKWQGFYLRTDLGIERASGGNFNVFNSENLVLNQWNHVAWVCNGVNDWMFINGVKSSIGTIQSPSNIMDVLIGARWSTDDPDSGTPTREFTGSLKNGWYFDRALLDVEISYMVDNNL